MNPLNGKKKHPPSSGPLTVRYNNYGRWSRLSPNEGTSYFPEHTICHQLQNGHIHLTYLGRCLFGGIFLLLLLFFYLLLGSVAQLKMIKAPRMIAGAVTTRPSLCIPIWGPFSVFMDYPMFIVTEKLGLGWYVRQNHMIYFTNSNKFGTILEFSFFVVTEFTLAIGVL